ncbi:MAG: UTP--glucose-1-phosphate uridylyltransferase [bacterium]
MLKKKITKAIVAVAGSGTRLLPATKAMPKEMLPIVDKPIIQLVVEELVEAGIEDIILVTKWDKKPLEDHFDYNWALINELKQAGKIELASSIKKIADLANFIYVRQKGPYGNGTPILSAASLVKNEPFVYCFGDDLVKSAQSFTKQMLTDFDHHGKLMLGVQEVARDQVERYGVVKLRENTMEIEDIIEKPNMLEAPSRLAAFGRYIFDEDIIDILRHTALGKGNELWITDAIKQYVKSGNIFLAKAIVDGEWLTTGDPLNYLEASLKYALDREDIGSDIRKFLKSI